VLDPDVTALGPAFFRRYADQTGIALVMGLDAHLIYEGPVSEIKARARRFIEEGGSTGRFILYINDIPYDTPSEHVHAVVSVAREYQRDTPGLLRPRHGLNYSVLSYSPKSPSRQTASVPVSTVAPPFRTADAGLKPAATRTRKPPSCREPFRCMVDSNRIHGSYELKVRGTAMSLRARVINLHYSVAKGSKRVRTLLTPVGAIFFFAVIILMVLLFLRIDTCYICPLFPLDPGILCSPFPCLLWPGFRSVVEREILYGQGTPVPLNPPPKVVTTGPYAYVRNPMLTGVFLMLFGIGLLPGPLP